MGLDYNDLTLPSDGHLFEETQLEGPISDIVLDNPGPNGSTYYDGEDTFITGEDPNNYIWYSGKLWRAVSVNNDAKTTKLITQWSISSTAYDDSSSAFEGSHMQQWLNDTTEDGFLGNLRDYQNFIVTDYEWNATQTTSTSKPPKTTMVESAVGLLNNYEYETAKNSSFSSYLDISHWWWFLTPYNATEVYYVTEFGVVFNINVKDSWNAIRPAINLKSSVEIVSGDGTVSNPYRIAGDNDTNLSGTKLNTRYSGEYITFGTGENTLYRIVSHEVSGLTKITSAELLKNSGSFVTSAFGSNENYSSTNTIGSFLNGEYLTDYVGSNYSDMIEDNTTWYLGRVPKGANYKLAKYTNETDNILTSSTATAKVGLLRYGELMAGQFDINENNISYWTLTPYTSGFVLNIEHIAVALNASVSKTATGIKPSMNLKSNVVITGGTGTKENPFTVELGS